MWQVGIDLHRKTVVTAAVSDKGEVCDARTFSCQDRDGIISWFLALGEFRAVIEATETYRWLYDLLSPLGTVLLAHPHRLRVMIQRRSKTDKLDAMLLAQLLRIDQVPLAYVPPERYQVLREKIRYRVHLGQELVRAKTALRGLLARKNLEAPYRYPFGVRGKAWFRSQDFGMVGDTLRDGLLEQLELIETQVRRFEEDLPALQAEYPEVEALTCIRGIGLYTALLVVAELGEVERFRHAKQVGAYAGLTPRVQQSGAHCYHGGITRQGSSYLRWAMQEAALKVTQEDARLAAFYARVRKRSSKMRARVAVARALTCICWIRLRAWWRAKAAA